MKEVYRKHKNHIVSHPLKLYLVKFLTEMPWSLQGIKLSNFLFNPTSQSSFKFLFIFAFSCFDYEWSLQKQ